MEENLDLEYNNNVSERPTFITVLCILSWIYVTFSVLSSLSSAFTSQEDLEEQLEISRAQIEESPMASNDMMQDIIAFSEKTMEHNKTTNLIGMILMLIQGAAVYMMFKLNKIGFWIYLLVNVSLIGVTAYFVPWPNVMSSMTIIFSSLIAIVFIILYGVNLKHMK